MLSHVEWVRWKFSLKDLLPLLLHLVPLKDYVHTESQSAFSLGV